MADASVTPLPFARLPDFCEDDAATQTGKWRVLLDPSGKADIFLRYRNYNYLDVADPGMVAAESLRINLVGAIRYGKTLVINVRDFADVDFFADKCRDVHKGLWDALLDTSVRTIDYFGPHLVKPGDATTRGPEWHIDQFLPRSDIKVIFLAKDLAHLDKSLATRCDVFETNA